jgi:hypothetical protein
VISNSIELCGSGVEIEVIVSILMGTDEARRSEARQDKARRGEVEVEGWYGEH